MYFAAVNRRGQVIDSGVVRRSQTGASPTP